MLNASVECGREPTAECGIGKHEEGEEECRSVMLHLRKTQQDSGLRARRRGGSVITRLLSTRKQKSWKNFTAMISEKK